MRKPLIAFGLIALLVLTQFIVMAPLPRKSLRAQINPYYLHAMAAYKRLEPKLSPQDLRAITTIGILNGAKEAEQKMQAQLVKVVKDLVETTDVNDPKSVLPKITKIEQHVQRDQQALKILSSAMDVAVGKLNINDFRKEMQHKKSNEIHEDSLITLEDAWDGNQQDEEVGNKIAKLRKNILNEMDVMKKMVDEKIGNTLVYIIDEADDDGLIAQASERVLHKRNANSKDVVVDEKAEEEPAEVRMINSILSEADFRNNLIEPGPKKRKDTANTLEDDFEFDDLTKNVVANRSSGKNTTKGQPVKLNNNIRDIINAVVGNATTNRSKEVRRPAKQEIGRPAKQEIGPPEIPEDGFGEGPDGDIGGDDGGGGGGGGGGGLVGIITSLSGGEGGSDIGALLGALTGLISTLFGPGGLDVESLISSGTSLIAGLLSGNRNFGTVLGIYVGTALDGLSGGGGAINNGRFIGNFLGTVVASLSADPEDEDEPIKPFIFAENLINTFLEAKNRKGSDEEPDASKEHGHKHPKKEEPKGSDSGAFVKSIVSHLVSQAISVILNASLGAVGGAAHASSSLFASSSHKSH